MIPIALAEIAPEHIKALVANHIEEGPTLEFKRDVPGDTRDERKEFVADVCALANSRGGDLIVGIGEDHAGRADTVVPKAINADELILRLTNIVADGLEPRLHGVSMRAIEMESGKSVLVIRVPRSTAGIHRSAMDRHFWIRESRSKRPLDVPAVANRFRDLFAREDRVADFFARRYAAISGGSYSVPLFPGPKVVVHFLPARDFLYGEEVDLGPALGPGQFPVMSSPMGRDATMTFKGVLHHSNPVGGAMRAVSLVFRNGVVEGVCNAIPHNAPEGFVSIPLESVEAYVEGLFVNRLTKWHR